MIVPVLGFVLIFLPAVNVQLGYQRPAMAEYKKITGCHPSALKLDAVDDLSLFESRYEVVYAACQTLVLSALDYSRLICTVDVYVAGKSPAAAV